MAISSTAIPAQVLQQDNSLRVAWLDYEYVLGEQEPGRFGPVSLKVDGHECLADKQPAWFCFLTKQGELRQDEGSWKYAGHSERQMANGGLETSVVMEGEAAQVVVQMRFTAQAVLKQRFILRPLNDKTSLELAFEDDGPRMELAGHRLSAKATATASLTSLRLATWLDKDYFNAGSGRLSDNHAYFPVRMKPEDNNLFCDKGPVLFIEGQDALSALFAYEHGSWDNDPGETYFEVRSSRDAEGLAVSAAAKEIGSYLDGESVTTDRPYESVWCDLGVFTEGSCEHALFEFVHSGIAEHMASRKPMIYYNTYGDQCDAYRTDEPLTERVGENRILRHIKYAAEMGCTHFVVDYGWEQDFGEWRIDRQKFPGGLAKIVEACREVGMELGLWMEPLSINSENPYCKQHPEGLVRDADGNPHSVYHLNQHLHFGCLSSPFFECLQEMHFELIDQGVTFFKWDWIVPDPCHAPNHEHGAEKNSPENRRKRAMFRSIERMAALAESLSERNPACVIEFDVTEAQRQVGLAWLSASKYFWYNFGSQDAREDMGVLWMPRELRKQPASYGNFLPSVLFNAANTTLSDRGSRIMRYNVHSTILGMGGLWGNLDKVKDYDRYETNFIVKGYKQLGDAITSAPLRLTGGPGESPEVYECIGGSAGQVVAFAEKPMAFEHRTQPLDTDALFLISETPYEINETGEACLRFDMAEWSSAHAFVYDRMHVDEAMPPVCVLGSTKGIWKWELLENRLRLYPYPGNESVFRLRVSVGCEFTLLSGKALEVIKRDAFRVICVSNIALAPLEIAFAS